MKKILINADDFGWNESCTQAIIEAFKLNYITTTTICANGKYFDQAVDMAIRFGYKTSVGIHLNITEGKALTEKIKMYDDIYEGGQFNHKFSRITPLPKEKKIAIYQEMTEQVLRFKATGLTIHHADSHNHIHNSPSIFPIFMRVVREQEIPKVRLFRNIGEMSMAKTLIKSRYNSVLKRQGYAYSDYFGSFEDFSFHELPEDGMIEMMVHPDYQDGELIDRSPDAAYDSPFGTKFDDIYSYITGKEYKISVS